MGCANSKVDDLPAVALCRDRCSFLDQAVHHRFALSQAHLAYLHSLKSVGSSLHRFFDQDLASPPPPHKPDPQSLPSTSTATSRALDKKPTHGQHHHHSHSGSHLQFNSDSEDDDDDDDDDDGSLHHHHDHHEHEHDHDHSGASSPLHLPMHLQEHVGVHDASYGYVQNQENSGYGYGGGGGSYMHMNYMKNQATPSVVYEQRPMSPEIVHMGESSTSSAAASYYDYPDYQNPNMGYKSRDFMGGFSGSTQPVMPYGGQSLEASSSKAPPPPPSPPRASPWEFLNPFESFEKYYPPYSSSRDSRELREEEGIPELEEEEDEDHVYAHEVVKEVHGDQKFVDGKGGGGGYSKGVAPDEEHGKGIDVETLHTSRPSPSVDSDPMEYEVHMVDKKVVNDDKRAGNHANVGRGAFKGDADVMKEIQVQFERAADSGNDLAVLLEVGKLPYNRKHSAYQGTTPAFRCFHMLVI